MIKMQKLKTIMAPVILALSLGYVSSVQAEKELTASDVDWTGGVVTCRMLQYIMENEMGYKVNKITMPAGPNVNEAIVNGDLDFACETWPSYEATKSKYIKEFGGDGSIVHLGETGIIGGSGYYVPRYMLEGDSARGIQASTPDLKSYKDLNQYNDLFKSLESGDRGSIYGCPVAAWECFDQKRLDILGVDFVARALGSETAHWAEIQAKFKRGETFLAYAWTPHWIHAAVDLVEIELPEFDAEKWPGTNWAQDITFNRGSPDMIAKHPEIAQLIRNQHYTNEQQAVLIYEIDVKKRDLDEVVEEWMLANRDIWEKWIP